MKKLLLKLTLFFLPVLLVGIVAEHLLRAIPNDYKAKKEQYEKHGPEFEMLCLGESHAFSGINPKYMSQKGFNGSHFAQTLNYDLEILKKFEHKLTKLNYLLLPISYASFTNRLEDQWEIKNYFLYYDIKQRHNLRYCTEILSLPLEISLDKIKNHYIANQSSLLTDSLGYSTFYSQPNPNKNLAEEGKKMAEVQTTKNYSNWNKNKQSLTDITAFCKRKNITLILFTPPAHHLYRIHLDTLQLHKTIELAESFAKNNTHVHYLNLLEESSFNADDFYDADHFSRDGAKKLSSLLNTFIAHLKKGSVD